MIDACIRLLKKYPYIFMGCIGIGLMKAPVIVSNNLTLISTIHPIADRVFTPLLTSPAFQLVFGSLPFVGLALAIISILLNDHSDPPPKC